jgi:DNA-binding protein H-NS
VPLPFTVRQPSSIIWTAWSSVFRNSDLIRGRELKRVQSLARPRLNCDMHLGLPPILRKSRVAPSCRPWPCLVEHILEADMKDKILMSMSVDQLWDLHEAIVTLLSTKIDTEKRELERRLARLRVITENKPNARRPYPKVPQKYRNPERPSETWSGRGKQPHWVGAQLRSGKKFDELLIAQTH